MNIRSGTPSGAANAATANRETEKKSAVKSDSTGETNQNNSTASQGSQDSYESSAKLNRSPLFAQPGLANAGSAGANVRTGNEAAAVGDGSQKRLDEVGMLFDDGSKTEGQDDDGRSQEIRTAGKGGIQIRDRVITGMRYGDTFEGERANERAGAGMYDSHGTSGGGKGQSSFPGTSGTYPGQSGVDGKPGGPIPIPYPTVGEGSSPQQNASSGEIPASQGDAAGASAGVSSGSVMGPASVQEAVSSLLASLPGAPRIQPREDDTGGGGEAKPIPLGKQGDDADRSVKPRGQDDGAGDGRGATEGASESTRMSDKAVGTEVGSTDKEMKRDDRGKVSYEQMLKANQHTDPRRS